MLVILSETLLPIKPPVASAIFWIPLFEAEYNPSDNSNSSYHIDADILSFFVII